MLSRKSYEENAQDVETAMFLATSYDKASEAWTKFSPNRLVIYFLCIHHQQKQSNFHLELFHISSYQLETIINVRVKKVVSQAVVCNILF